MFKKLITNLAKKFTLYFVPKTIVLSYNYPEGLLVKATELNRKKYITIAVTNRAVKDEPNSAVIYHVPLANVYGVRKSTTPFEKWYYGKLLHKPCPSKPLKLLVD
jgi:hypothetical protein